MGWGMAAMRPAKAFRMANTHSVFANAQGDVHLASFEDLAHIVELRPVPEQLRMRMSSVTTKSVE